MAVAVAGLGAGVGLLAVSARAVRPGDRLRVVAAESTWGSLAAQLGGDRVQVTSVVRSPATDPHDYEPTAADARAVAEAGLVIETGAGYDPWAGKLVAANPSASRVVLDVGRLVGVPPGGNPHRWYDPADVGRVVAAIAADFRALDPRHARWFARRETRLETRGLARYHRLLATIARRFGGVPVGASESIVAPLAHALRLRLLTPPSFLRAISEGGEPTAADLATIERQIAHREIRVWVVDGQNGTPDVARLTAAARAHGIPVATVTETLSPASASFQQWQVAQLTELKSALHAATNR